MVRLSASGCNIKSRYLTLPLHKMHAACFSHKKKETQSKSREQRLQKTSTLLNSWINMYYFTTQDFLRAGLCLIYLHRTG